MENGFFKHIETLLKDDSVDLKTVLAHLQFNQQGLIPAIIQQYDTQEVLMMAWMNRDSLIKTLSKKQTCYWSRSRQQLWHKGESSGHRQRLIEMRIDCDGDVLLCFVDQIGPACHSGHKNCFYLSVQNDCLTIISNPDSIN